MPGIRPAIVFVICLASFRSALAETAADDAFRAAENLLGAGRWLEAAEACGRFAERFPADARAGRARFSRGEALFRAGRLEEALAALGPVKDDPLARFRAANVQYLLGRADAAAAAFASLLDGGKLPGELEGPTRYFHARSLLALGRADEARAALEAFGGKSGPAAAYVKLALGDILAALSGDGAGARLEDALSAYRSALEAGGGGRLAAEALFRIGEVARRGGDDGGAIEHYRRAVETAPGGAVAPYARLGAAWAKLGKGDQEGALEEAVAAAEAARAAGVGEPRLADEIAYVRGTAEFAAGRYEAACGSLSALIDRKESTVPRDRLLHRLGWSAVFARKPDLALRAASALLATDPPAERAAGARLVAGEAELLSGRPAEALEHFASAASSGGGEAESLAAYGRAKALAALGKPAEAAAAFDGFSSERSRHPLAAAARILAARAYLAAGEAAVAAERFGEARSAYAGGPLEAEVLWGASLAEYMRGEFGAMAALDREIVDRFPNSSRAADAAYWLAWSRLAEKDFGGAAEAFADTARRAKGTAAGQRSRPGLAAAALLEAASALERAGDRKGALGVALDLVSGELAAHVPLEAALWAAEALRETGQADRAAGILDAALGRAASAAARARVLYARAELVRRSGKPEEAVALYERALDSEPGEELAAAVRLGKARCLVAGGRRAEAEVLLENMLDKATGWGRAAAYCELADLRLGTARESEGEKRARLAARAAEDFMFVALLYEPGGPGEGAGLCARSLFGAARAYVLLERYASARARLERLITHPLYGTMPEAREARKLLQQIPLEELGVND